MHDTKKIIIIGSDIKWEEKGLLKAIKQEGCQGKILEAYEIDIVIKGAESQLFYRNKNITRQFKNSRIIFRRTRGAQEKMITLAMLAKHWKLKYTDSVKSIMSNLSKAIFMPSVNLKKPIHHIETAFVSRGESINPKALPSTFPILAKPVYGRHGEGITIIKKEGQLNNFLKKNTKNMMVQPFLNIQKEYRIFVIKNKSIGVIEKTPEKGSTIANYAAGATFTKSKLPEGVIKSAIQICEEQNIDIGGVDIAKAGSKFYLLEVNRCPEFRAFSEATKINVAKKIIEFILKK